MQPLRLSYRHLRFLRPGHPTLVGPLWCSVQNRQLSTSPPLGVRGKKTRDLSDDQININLFDDEIDGPSRQRRRVDLDQESGEEEALDNQINTLKRSINAFEVEESISEDTKRTFFTDEQLRQLEADTGLDDNLLPYQISPQKAIPRQSQVYVNRLNEALDEASLDSSGEEVRSKLWRWYTRSKSNVPDLLRMIPKTAWDLLWDSQASDAVTNPDRTSHLRTLADDKAKAGWDLNEDERYARLEGTFLDGDHESALELYEIAMAGPDGEKSAYLEMGIRMYAHRGNAERAHELLDKALSRNQSADPRLIVPVLNVYAGKKDDDALSKAWELYQQMQQRLSSDMSVEDYDSIALVFLAAGQKDHALAVFRDLMLCGEAKKKGALFNLGRDGAISRIGDFLSVGSAQQTTELGLDAIKYLPRRFQNKYFYASWLRKLISDGQHNAAAQVTELMYERRVKPDAKHMNGLVSAWLREGNVASRERAEAMSWAMIQARIDYTDQRRRKNPGLGSAIQPKRSIDDGPEGVVVPSRTSRPVPAATIETFCILLQNYLRRSMFQHVRHLRDLLVEAELSMNSFFMNHLMYAELRNRGYRSAWSRFEILSHNVKPDVETFSCLWECLKAHIHEVRNHQHAEADGLPTPRELFARMMQWLDGLQGQSRQIATDDIDMNAYHDILRVLCISHDVEGTLIAMHTFRHRFALIPNDATIRMLLMQIARLSPAPRKQQYPRSLRRRAQNKSQTAREQDMEHANAMYDVVRNHRADKYDEQGYDVDELREEQQAEEMYRSCLALLFAVMRRRREASLGAHYIAVNQAAEGMGVERFDVDACMKLVVDDE